MAHWEVAHFKNPTHAILSAAHFAAQKHTCQKRKGEAGEPYINHLLEVAQLVSGAVPEPDPHMVMAALLHDTIEDVGVTWDDLAQHFGSDVADLVAEVTDDKSLSKTERKRLQVENAPHKSERAQAIKLADKISNLRSMLTSPPAGWDAQRIREYRDWSRRVVNGLASPNPSLRAEFEGTLLRFDD